MECRSCLDDPAALVVADASVAINLNATGFAESILDALPNRVAVVEEVVLELESGQRRGRSDADALKTLAGAGLVDIVQLAGPALERFRSLVSGSATATLDDGEAATIAFALEESTPEKGALKEGAVKEGAVALIDDGKAIKVCTERYGALAIGCTVDLLLHDSVEAALGRDGLVEAVFNALRHARMRVLPQHLDWVVDLIGPERAAQCPSLPRSVRRR